MLLIKSAGREEISFRTSFLTLWAREYYVKNSEGHVVGKPNARIHIIVVYAGPEKKKKKKKTEGKKKREKELLYYYSTDDSRDNLCVWTRSEKMRSRPWIPGSLTFRQLYPPSRASRPWWIHIIIFRENDIFRNIFHLPLPRPRSTRPPIRSSPPRTPTGMIIYRIS